METTTRVHGRRTSFWYFGHINEKKRGRNADLKKNDVIKSFIEIKDKQILKSLEDIPILDTDSDFVRVNNFLIFICIAHKIRLEYVWQSYLNFIVPNSGSLFSQFWRTYFTKPFTADKHLYTQKTPISQLFTVILKNFLLYVHTK